MLYTLHYDNNYSESIRTNIDAENANEAKEIAEQVGFNVVRVNEDMHMVIVANDQRGIKNVCIRINKE